MAGRGRLPRLDLRHPTEEVVDAIVGVTAGGRPWHPEQARLLSELRQAGETDGLIDCLADTDPGRRLLAVRACAALQLPDALYPLRTRLADRDHSVRVAAARALGRIGGRAAADGLVDALLNRRLRMSRLAIELGRAAPDFYLVEALRSTAMERIHAALALAASIQRSRANVEPLTEQLGSPSPRDRRAAARALAAIDRRRPGAGQRPGGSPPAREAASRDPRPEPRIERRRENRPLPLELKGIDRRMTPA